MSGRGFYVPGRSVSTTTYGINSGGLSVTLRQKQSEFTKKLALLILFAYDQGYEVTLGDAWAKDGHKEGSFHYDRLAVDLNLFRNGTYLTTTEDHLPLGLFWETLGSECTWGGHWDDGCHYSYGER